MRDEKELKDEVGVVFEEDPGDEVIRGEFGEEEVKWGEEPDEKEMEEEEGEEVRDKEEVKCGEELIEKGEEKEGEGEGG